MYDFNHRFSLTSLFFAAVLLSCSGGTEVSQDTGIDFLEEPSEIGAVDGSMVPTDMRRAADTTPDAPDVSDYSVPPGCNGAEQFCERHLNEFTFATTHNANNNLEQGFVVPNQSHSLTRQLQDGIRALMIDVWDDGGVTSMCHSSCRLGSKPLIEGLYEIDEFLRRHPSEVVVILFESNVSSARIAATFEDAGVSQRVATLAPETPLPTLGALAEANTPWVVFTQDGGGDPDWYHPMWQYLWDTDYSAERVEDFSCDILRGDRANPLFLVNHFLTNPVGSKPLARTANEEEYLRSRVLQCWRDSGQRPNFVAVDFYEIGGVMTLVRELNALDAPPD